jgi:hypothetical protein
MGRLVDEIVEVSIREAEIKRGDCAFVVRLLKLRHDVEMQFGGKAEERWK